MAPIFLGSDDDLDPALRKRIEASCEVSGPEIIEAEIRYVKKKGNEKIE